MGREIRKVPPNWDHPKQQGWPDGRLQPMHDERFEKAASDWKEAYALWEAGARPPEYRHLEYWEYEGSPPQREYYRPWQDNDATWFHVWETVSEGTPVTPPFETAAELVNYLATHGDCWDQKRGHGPWPREHAEKFVAQGWAPSMIIQSSPSGTQILRPRDGG